MPLPRRTANPQADAARFNAKVKVGDAIEYREIQGEGPAAVFKTRAPAEVLGGHTAVVWLEGKVGCVCVAHCVAANGPQFITDPAAIEAAFASDQEAEDTQRLRGAA